MAAATALVPEKAEAKGCSDHLLTSFHTNSNVQRSDVPKTRRVRKSRKNVPAALARSVPKPAVPTVVQVRATERPHIPSFLEELEIESFIIDLVLDDPRRTLPRGLRFVRIDLGLVTYEVAQPSSVLEAWARPAMASLRTRMLPKIPDSGDDASLV